MRWTELESHSGGMLGLAGTGVTIAASAIRGVGPELLTVDMPAPPGEENRTIPLTVRLVT